MRRLPTFLTLISAAAVAGLAVAIGAGRMPLGVRGEWEWPRLKVGPTALDLLIALAGVGGFAAFAGLGMRAHLRGTRRGGWWLVGLLVAAPLAQVVVLSGAPTGYGLTKWVTLALPGSSGYATVARREMADPWRFWAAYPTWIRGQDALHIGTHPPGLFLGAWAAQELLAASPAAVAGVDAATPSAVATGFRQIVGLRAGAERASLVLTGWLTLLACAATAGPLYALARWSGLGGAESWAAAALWPLLPSALLFQPTADTAFPLLSTLALALAARGGRAAWVGCGAVLGLGMIFTLAFLPVGLAVALVIGSGRETWRGRLVGVGVVGLGFLGITLLSWAVSGANPFVIWWWNQRNHARFYVEYPRSYAPWVVVNAVELAVAVGLPAAVWAIAGACRRPPRAFWAAVVVLLVLDLSGRNLSEVARLWLPLMPPLLLGAGAGIVRHGGGAATLGATVGLVGLQAVALQSLIQVVYPV